MRLLKAYFDIQKEIYDHFSYVEDWVVIPLDDATKYYWRLHEDVQGGGYVVYAETLDQLNSDGDYCKNEIYTQRFLSQWVYEAADYTMICVDTRVDGNKFLQVFDNTLQQPRETP